MQSAPPQTLSITMTRCNLPLLDLPPCSELPCCSLLMYALPLPQNGLAHPSQEPARIRKVHEEEIAFIAEWLKDFKP